MDIASHALISTGADHADAIVIGAGPYGLAVAAHLRGKGFDIRVFGRTLESWSDNMPDGMFLKSTPDATDISAGRPGFGLADFCRATGRTVLEGDTPIPVELFVDYGRWFQQQLVPIDTARVVRVTRRGDDFRVELDDGRTVEARSVIVAAGHMQFTHTPTEFAALATDTAEDGTPFVSHMSDHSDYAAFAGRRVAVIGGGQSALESAALLHEAGADVDVLVRAPRVLWAGIPDEGPRSLGERMTKPSSPLGPGWSLWACSRGAGIVRFLPERARLRLVSSVLGPAGSWWLRNRVDGKVRISTSTRVDRATREGDAIVLDCVTGSGARRRIDVDHVVAATGYRVDVDAITFLDAPLRAAVDRVGGYPKLDAGFQSNVPGLYFVGLPSAASFGPLMRFVAGTDFAAGRTAAAVVARGRSPIRI